MNCTNNFFISYIVLKKNSLFNKSFFFLFLDFLKLKKNEILYITVNI